MHILLILDNRCVQDDEVIISIFDQNPVSFIEFVVVGFKYLVKFYHLFDEDSPF